MILYFHYIPTPPEVQRNINTYIGKCFKKKNQELIQDLQEEYRDSSIPSIKKILKCNLHKISMNQAIRHSWK